jgi:hypothetical protein
MCIAAPRAAILMTPTDPTRQREADHHGFLGHKIIPMYLLQIAQFRVQVNTRHGLLQKSVAETRVGSEA